MSEQTNVSIRMDSSVKQQFDYLCKELGLSMSAAINIFVKTVIREKCIPFEISLNIPNKETMQAIEETEKGIGLSKAYDSVDELMKDMEI